jgi:hypothetical protein
MTPYRHTKISSFFIALFFLVLGMYAYYESRAYLYGPVIHVPTSQTVVHDPMVLIRGKADNIASLFMNGKQIPVSEEGVFEQPYALAVGYNKIILYATDQYGAGKEEIVEVVYEPLVISATTTESTPTLAPEN